MTFFNGQIPVRLKGKALYEKNNTIHYFISFIFFVKKSCKRNSRNKSKKVYKMKYSMNVH
jgi:hypothetical protein